MEQVYVHGHATKHGLSTNQVRHAWINAVAMARRDNVDGTQDYVAIGFDQSGRPIEMVAAKNQNGFLVFHANTPPTARAFRELGLKGGRHGRQRA